MKQRRVTIGFDPLDVVVPEGPVDLEGQFSQPGSEWLGELSDAEYSPAAAWLTAVASTWAYADAATLKKVLELCMGPVQITSLSADNGAILVDTQGWFVRSLERPIALLAFRGTQFGEPRFTDLLTDISMAPRQLPPGGSAKVHGGFFRALACVWHDVLAVLEKHRDLERLYLTGHSLGGAIAALAAAMLFGGVDEPLQAEGSPIHRHLIDPDGMLTRTRRKLERAFSGLYTFGQPMVGDPGFVRACSASLQRHTYRHVYNDDWVPTVPPTEAGRFEHFGREFRAYASTGKWKEQSSSSAQSLMMGIIPATLDFFAAQLPWGRNTRMRYSLADHIPQNYVDVSRNAAPMAPSIFP